MIHLNFISQRRQDAEVKERLVSLYYLLAYLHYFEFKRMMYASNYVNTRPSLCTLRALRLGESFLFSSVPLCEVYNFLVATSIRAASFAASLIPPAFNPLTL